MRFQTERMIIRSFKDSDIESFLVYRNIPEVALYQGWDLPFSREAAVQLVNEVKEVEIPRVGRWLQLALELKDTHEMIGDIGIRIQVNDPRQAVIGFTIAPAYWRRGYASEAVTALLGYLFDDLGLHRVSADCDTENVGSWRTLEKAGFRLEAHFVENYPIGERYASEYVYGMLRREWMARKRQG